MYYRYTDVSYLPRFSVVWGSDYFANIQVSGKVFWGHIPSGRFPLGRKLWFHHVSCLSFFQNREWEVWFDPDSFVFACLILETGSFYGAQADLSDLWSSHLLLTPERLLVVHILANSTVSCPCPSLSLGSIYKAYFFSLEHTGSFFPQNVENFYDNDLMEFCVCLFY